MEDMTHEEIQQLLLQINTLRQENEELRNSLNFSSVETINGYEDPSEVFKDTVFKGLKNQLSVLGKANQQFRSAATGYEDLEKSMSTLLPALEVQLRGWNNEILNLRQSIEQSENTYAGIVEKLEHQLRQLKISYLKELAEQKAQHQAREEALQAELKAAKTQIQGSAERSTSSQRTEPSAPKRTNPFRTLSIYDYHE
jgi:uncharacterized protein (DUF342 family)